VTSGDIEPLRPQGARRPLQPPPGSAGGTHWPQANACVPCRTLNHALPFGQCVAPEMTTTNGPIDHLADRGGLGAGSVRVWPRVEGDRRLSDHDGVVVEVVKE